MSETPVVLSTGTLRGAPAPDLAEPLLAAGAEGIELSAGDWAPDLAQRVRALASEVPVNLHNYFPPPPTPFALNLASSDPVVADASVAHVRAALALSAAIGAPDYGVHAGFLVDPPADQLGRPLGPLPVADRDEGLARFTERVRSLAAEAADLGVALWIENNVLSRANLARFGTDPLLCTTPRECAEVLAELEGGVGLLLDVAHAKVSGATLGFDPHDFAATCESWIRAYHLSDNDGSADSNGPVRRSSWFWPVLQPGAARITLEVTGLEADAYVAQATLVREVLGAGA